MMKRKLIKPHGAIHVCCDSSEGEDPCDSSDSSVILVSVDSEGQGLSQGGCGGIGLVGSGAGSSSVGSFGEAAGWSSESDGCSSGGIGLIDSGGGRGASSANVERGGVGGVGLDHNAYGRGGGGRGNASVGRGRGRAGLHRRPLIQAHRHPGVFIAKRIGDGDDLLVTKNLVPGFNVYGENKILVKTDGEKVEYRIWNPYESTLAAAIVGGVENIYMPVASQVLYLGASSGSAVSHVADIVGPEGMVYAVESSKIFCKELVNIATRRPNILPIWCDARHPFKYRMLLGMVDCIFSDIAQPDQAKIVGLNARLFLKTGGHFVICIKASSYVPTENPEEAYQFAIRKLNKEKLIIKKMVRLEPYKHNCVVMVGTFRPHLGG